MLLIFKYISCFYLSIPRPSTVTSSLLFKYISCFYLSSHAFLGDDGVWLFKYISCFYLSHLRFQMEKLIDNSNTSHVSIYPYALSFTEKEDRFKYISCFYLSNLHKKVFAIF